MGIPTTIAHRGFAGVAPENTIGAAQMACTDDNTTLIEIDVRPAACGTPVVFHDDRLDGSRNGRPITDGTGRIGETSLDEVTAATVLGTDETIPTLTSFLDAIPASVGVNVELKNPGRPATDLRPAESLPPDERSDRTQVWSPFVDRVVNNCEGFDGEILVSSFCEGALAAIRECAPRYPAAVLVGADPAAALDVADRYDCEAVHPPRNAIRGTPLYGDPYPVVPGPKPDRNSKVDLLEAAHDAGRAVNVWTVTTWDQFDQLADAGVDGVIAEYPALDRSAGAANS